MALFSKAVKPTPTVKMPATAAKSTTVAPPTTTAAPTAASSQQTSCRPTTSRSASSNLPSNDASMCQTSAPNRTQPLDKVSELQVSRSPAPETTTSNEAFKSDYEPNLVLDREDYLLKYSHRAPMITIYVGPRRAEFVISKAILLYHCPSVKHILSREEGCHTLTLSRGDPTAFEYIVWRMTQANSAMNVSKSYGGIGDDINSAIEVCAVLCRVWFMTVESICMEGLENEILGELRAVTKRMRELGISTPIRANLVEEVWDRVGEESPLWQFLLEEINMAFSAGPFPEYEEFEECFQDIASFNKHINKHTLSIVRSVSAGHIAESAENPQTITKTNARVKNALLRKTTPLEEFRSTNERSHHITELPQKTIRDENNNASNDREETRDPHGIRPRPNQRSKSAKTRNNIPIIGGVVCEDLASDYDYDDDDEDEDNMSETLRDSPGADAMGGNSRKRSRDDSEDGDSEAGTDIVSPKRIKGKF